MIEIISMITIIILFIILIVQTILYSNKYKRLIRSIAQLVVEKEALVNKLDMLVLDSSKEVNDGFIKFISDSRQAAFDYIENVQIAIQNYLDAINTGSQDEVVAARMELFNHLPEETEK